MKKYKLKKWYLGLSSDLEQGQVVDYVGGHIMWRVGNTTYKWSVHYARIEDENYWEEIEPLFQTADNWNVFPEDKVFLIAHMKTEIGDIGISQWTAQEIVNGWNVEDIIVFYSRARAEEYRWKNSKLYSYNDIARGLDLYGLDVLEAISKKMIGHE